MIRTTTHRNRTRVLGLLGAVALGLVSVMPGLAAGTVTQTINCSSAGNSLAASIADLTLTIVSFAPTVQDSSGNLALSAAEIGCEADGWNVTVQASDWARTGGGVAIPAINFSLMTIATPTVVSGQPINATGGPKLVNSIGALNLSRKVLQANIGYGLGSYAQVLGAKLTIPGYTLPGIYITTMTTTIQVGP